MRATCILFIFIVVIIIVKSENTQEEGKEDDWQNEMLRMPGLNAICTNFHNVSNVSTKCKEQLSIVCGNLSLLLTMLDASSNFPYTGLGYSTKTDFGNFDQCLTIDHSYEGGRILGEFCTESLVIPDPFDNMSDANTFYTLSVCRPDGCNASDYNEIVEYLLDPRLPEVFLDDRCQKATPTEPFNIKEIVTLAIFAIVIWLMVMSTIYDTYVYKSHTKNIHSLLTTFSVLSNGRKLFHIIKHSTSREDIEVLNGLRVISMMWIITGHGFMSWEKVPVSNIRVWGDTWRKHLSAGYVLTAHVAVDTFFYISGLVMAFKYLQHKDKSLLSQMLALPQMYLHRYLRLTPALLMVYLVNVSIMNRLGSGPLWNSTNTAKICTENWLAVFLYVQNYHNYDNICLVQTWFLSAVMQLFLISPLVLIPLSLTLRKPLGFKKAMIGLVILNVLSILLPMAHKLHDLNYKNEYDAHSRLIDYFMGVTLGVFMRENIDKPFLFMVRKHRKSVINFVTWVLIIFGMAVTLICYQLVQMRNEYKEIILFQSLMRPAWCIGLTWIIYSSYHGYGGFVNWILCRPIFQILGRLTYCIYLLHQSIIDYNVWTTRGPWYFTDYNAFYLFCGHYLVSIIFAIFWTLAFESPVIALERYLRQTHNFILEQSPSSQTENNEEAQLKNLSKWGN